MEFIIEIIKILLRYLVGMIILVVIYFLITLPFALPKYLIDKEKPFLITWFNYAVNFEKFLVIMVRLGLIIFIIFLIYLSFI
jgi:hypothetical protein